METVVVSLIVEVNTLTQAKEDRQVLINILEDLEDLEDLEGLTSTIVVAEKRRKIYSTIY